MRTAEEIRDRLRNDFRLAVHRPSMWFGRADNANLILFRMLYYLSFIEGKDDTWPEAASSYVGGCRAVLGQFEFQHRPFPDYLAEVTSVYAAVGYALGHFLPDRLRSLEELERLADAAEGALQQRDWTASELRAEFGTPSHEVGAADTTVACYAGTNPAYPWVFFDLARRLPGAAEGERLPEPVLRDVRDGYSNQMRLCPLGQRWARTGLHQDR